MNDKPNENSKRVKEHLDLLEQMTIEEVADEIVAGEPVIHGVADIIAKELKDELSTEQLKKLEEITEEEEEKERQLCIQAVVRMIEISGIMSGDKRLALRVLGRVLPEHYGEK